LSRANRKERSQEPQMAHLVEIKHYLKKKQQVTLIPRNLAQEEYIESLKNPKKYIVFAVGPAGTGKSMLAVQMAIKQFKDGQIDKIIITRPTVSVDEDLGFLPGTLTQKMEPWVIPIIDVFKEYYHPREIQKMLEDGVLEFAPLGMMRGRTFKNAFIIADEIQLTTPGQVKMLLTRIGDGSKMVLTGDLDQSDRAGDNGLHYFTRIFNASSDSKMIDVIQFSHKDIERHPVVKVVLDIFNRQK
jgi:phosphate starvation-inducible protein PhoH and related proteins